MRLLHLFATLAGACCAQAQATDAAAPTHAAIVLSRGSEAMHLEVGNLVMMDSPTRIKRVYIANPVILDSYTANPHQLVITAKAPGTSSVVVWDEFNQVHTYTVSADVPVSTLHFALDRALPKNKIEVTGDETRVILSGSVATVAEAETAGKLAAYFAKDVVNSLIVNTALVKQVRLKVRFVEVDRTRLNQFGINLFNPGGGSSVLVASTTQFPSATSLTSGSSTSGGYQVGANSLSVSDPLNFLFYSAKANLGLSIRDLENKQVLQILAEPNITAVSGQKASFLSGGEFPFPVVQSSTGTTSVTIQFRPYGVKLDFLADVNADGTISLKVTPEVSALDYTNAVTIAGYTIPALSTRHAETQVVLQSGQSFAISGLLDKRTTDILSRTPGITRIPILGALFKSKGVNLSTTELIVIVTPTLIDPVHEPLRPEEGVAEPKPVRPFLTDKGFDATVPELTRKTQEPGTKTVGCRARIRQRRRGPEG